MARTRTSDRLTQFGVKSIQFGTVEACLDRIHGIAGETYLAPTNLLDCLGLNANLP